MGVGFLCMPGVWSGCDGCLDLGVSVGVVQSVCSVVSVGVVLSVCSDVSVGVVQSGCADGSGGVG